jgi:hypothetical protein
MHYFSNLFSYRTLHISDRFIVHHQESSIVYTAAVIFFILFINQQSGYNVILLANAVAKESLAVHRVTVGGRAQWLDLVN